MDTLSDVLTAVRLSGAVYFDVNASPPWVAEAPPGHAIVSRIFPGADHLVSFHVITRGSCWGGLVDQPAVLLQAGDVIMFPHGDQHIMCSAPGMRGVPDADGYLPPSGTRLPFTIAMGPEGQEKAQLVCGFLGCDARPFNPLLASLPPIVHQRSRGDGVLAQFVRLAVEESANPRVGGGSVLSRLSELLFIDVVRHHLESLPEGQTGWLSGLRDPFVGRALAALHADPARPWTIESLARQVGLSRSALAERFASLVGQPPMHYLAKWRMQRAAAILLDGEDNVATVAAAVGYESEPAFSRAFKKVVGVPPGEWRRHKTGSRGFLPPSAGAASTGASSPKAAP